MTYACTRDSRIATCICSVSKNMGVAITYMLNIIYSQTILVIKMGRLTILKSPSVLSAPISCTLPGGFTLNEKQAEETGGLL